MILYDTNWLHEMHQVFHTTCIRINCTAIVGSAIKLLNHLKTILQVKKKVDIIISNFILEMLENTCNIN